MHVESHSRQIQVKAQSPEAGSSVPTENYVTLNEERQKQGQWSEALDLKRSKVRRVKAAGTIGVSKRSLGVKSAVGDKPERFFYV